MMQRKQNLPPKMITERLSDDPVFIEQLEELVISIRAEYKGIPTAKDSYDEAKFDVVYKASMKAIIDSRKIITENCETEKGEKKSDFRAMVQCLAILKTSKKGRCGELAAKLIYELIKIKKQMLEEAMRQSNLAMRSEKIACIQQMKIKRCCFWHPTNKFLTHAFVSFNGFALDADAGVFCKIGEYFSDSRTMKYLQKEFELSNGKMFDSFPFSADNIEEMLPSLDVLDAEVDKVATEQVQLKINKIWQSAVSNALNANCFFQLMAPVVNVRRDIQEEVKPGDPKSTLTYPIGS